MKVIKSQLIEVVLPGVAVTGNAATKIQFPDQPYLRNVSTLGIEIFTVNDMSLSPSNRVPLSAAQMKTAYLTLYLNDPENPADVGEWIQNVPFSVLHRTQNSATDPFVRFPYELAGQRIYWEKCYVTLPVAFANTADVSFLFNVYFKGKAKNSV